MNLQNRKLPHINVPKVPPVFMSTQYMTPSPAEKGQDIGQELKIRLLCS
jgi:hypothetical protein